jgi:DNA replication protein DnaC
MEQTTTEVVIPQAIDPSQKPENMTRLLSEARSSYYISIVSKSKIPKRYLDKTIENFDGGKELIEKSIKAIISGESVFIGGKCGVGKTHLSVGLLKKWAKEHTIKFINEKNVDSATFFSHNCFHPEFLASVDLFFELKSTFNSNTTDEMDVIKKYVETPLLVIDDVGAEKVSDWSRQMFYLLIDRRYRNMKPTIITSNLSLQQIAELIDERISSRICEMGIVTELTGRDRRVG